MSNPVYLEATPKIIFVGKRVKRSWVHGGDYLPEFKEGQKYAPKMKLGVEVLDASGKKGLTTFTPDQTANTQLIVVNMDDPSVKKDFLERVKGGAIAEKFPNATILATTYQTRFSGQTLTELRGYGIQAFRAIGPLEKGNWLEFNAKIRRLIEDKAEPAHILFVGQSVSKGNIFHKYLGTSPAYSPEMGASLRANLCKRRGKLISALGENGVLNAIVWNRDVNLTRVVVLNADNPALLKEWAEQRYLGGNSLKQAHILATSYQAVFPVGVEDALRHEGVTDFCALGALHKSEIDTAHAKIFVDKLKKMMARPAKAYVGQCGKSQFIPGSR